METNVTHLSFIVGTYSSLSNFKDLHYDKFEEKFQENIQYSELNQFYMY